MRVLLVVLISAFGTALAQSETTESTIKTPSELVAEARAEITEITPAQLSAGLETDLVLIDVRDSSKFNGGHIPGAANIQGARIQLAILDHLELTEVEREEWTEPANVKIVLYCGTGRQSALATQSLQSMGFRNVYSLKGGINAWKAAELPVEE